MTRPKDRAVLSACLLMFCLFCFIFTALGICLYAVVVLTA